MSKERTILLPKTTGTVFPDGLFQDVRTKKRGFGGNIISLKRLSLSPISIGWEISYKRGAGKSLKSRILGKRVFKRGRGEGIFRARTRSKRGPRFQFEVKF